MRAWIFTLVAAATIGAASGSAFGSEKDPEPANGDLEGQQSSPEVTTEELARLMIDRFDRAYYASALAFVDATTTARKREERLLEAPLAVTAVARDALEERNVRRTQDVASYVPNLAFGASLETSSAANLTLRGVGNGDSIASDDPGVGLYLDGIYLSRAQGALFSVFDTERIEVLRGPGGTLFGKNTIGGALSIVTAQPVLDELGGHVDVRLGNYRRFDTRLVLNVPLLMERAAARLSLATGTRDGFTKNKGAGGDLDDDKLLAARAQLLYLPTDNTQLLLSSDLAIEDRKPQGFKCKVSNPFSVGQNAANRPDLAASGTAFQSAGLAAGLAQQIGAADRAEQLGNLALGRSPFLAACAEDDARDDRSVASDLQFQGEDLRNSGASGTFTWDVGPHLTFRSITGWRRRELDQARDFDGTNLPLLALDSVDAGHEQQDQISQELQLIGKAFDERLRYALGLFYLREKITDRGNRGIAIGQDLFAPTVPGDLTTLRFQRSTFESTTLNVKNASYAAFAHASWSITDDLGASLGIRITRERKHIKRVDVCQGKGIAFTKVCSAPGEVPFRFEGSARFGDVSPLVTLDYRLDEGTSLYASWSRGFKSGGFNGRADSPADTNEIRDEKLTSYEVGFKTRLFDDRMKIDGALFYSLYDDIQQTIPRAGRDGAPVQLLVTNAGSAEIKGAELEIETVPLAGLNLSTTLGVTNARYVEFDLEPSPLDPSIPEDPEERRLPNTPSYTMNFAASYRFSLGDLGRLRTRLDWTHIGRSATDVNDSRLLRRGKSGELDARMVWSLPDGHTEVAVFGENLLDREYVVNGIDFGASLGHALRIYNAPRTYGLELRREF